MGISFGLKMPGGASDPAAQRRRVLLTAMPLIGFMTLTYLLSSGQQMRPGSAMFSMFLVSGVGILLLWPLLRLRWISTTQAAAVTTVGFALPMFTRIFVLFTSGVLDDPTQAVFRPVFAFFTTLYLLTALVLPFPLSRRVSFGTWLVFALTVTVGLEPYWSTDINRPQLLTTLIYVWLGHGLFLTLLFGWAREQHLLVASVRRLDASHREGEQARAESEQRFRAIYEQAGVGIGLIGADCRWADANERLCAMTGYTVEELRSQRLNELLPADEQTAACQRLTAFINGQMDVDQLSAERRWTRKDGSTIWVANHIRRIHVEGRDGACAAIVSTDISERKHAEQRALENERIREFHFENTPLAVIEWTPDFRVQRWSRQAERMFGWSESELLGHNPFDWGFVHEADLDEAHETAARLIQEADATSRMLIRIYRKDSSYGWYQWHHSVLRDTRGAVISVHSMAHDVSELRFALQALSESEGQLRGLFEQAAVGIAILGTDGAWLSVNDRLCEILGYSHDELLTLDFQKITHVDDLPKCLKLLAELAAGERPNFTIEMCCIRKDGAELWAAVYVRAIAATETTPLRFAAIIDDISERKLAEAQRLEHRREREAATEALHDSEKRFRSFFNQAAVGASLLNSDGSWHTVNERLCRITGYSEAELLATNFQSITVAEDLSLDMARAQQLMAGEIDGYEMEKRYIRKDGSTVWVKLHASCIEATATQPRLYVAVIEDISERKQAEADVQKLQAGLERKVNERTRQLQQTMRSWAERNHELSLLAEMMGVLPASRDVSEANQIVTRYLPKLFQQYGGAVYLEDGARDRFPLLKQWGEVKTSIGVLTSADCWALRRGQALRIEDPDDPLLCPHLDHQHGAQEPHACIPIMALGDIVGLIHLTWSERAGSTQNPPDKVLLASTAEQVGLAIGNVRLREELHQQAMRDPLTGLYNRRYFDEYLIRRIAEHARTGRGFVLLMIDIDLFKSINDRYGHEIGDEVLRTTAGLLERVVRADEAVFRLGGEEFVMIINDGVGSQALGCAERLRAEIEQHRSVHHGEELPPVTVSIGVACCPGDTGDGALLLQRADAALYAAKRTGRNRVCYAGAAPGHVVAAVRPTKSPALIGATRDSKQRP